MSLPTKKYLKQILMDIKGEINSNTIRVGDFNTLFNQSLDHLDWKINKETSTLNYMLDQIFTENSI